MRDSKDFTIFIKNFDSKRITYDLLLELFTQAGPVQNLTLKEDFAFVEFEDTESVMYACNLLNDTELFGKPLQVKPRSGSCWENEKLYIFTNSRSSNNSYNEFGQRQNNLSVNNACSEGNYRQMNRSSFHDADSLNYNIDKNNEYYYNQQNRQQMNNCNDFLNVHLQSPQDSNDYSNQDYSWPATTYSSTNYQNFGNFNNNLYQMDRRHIPMEMHSQNGGFHFSQDRRHKNSETLWRDKEANSSWTGPSMSRSFGNHRNRPY